MTDPSPSPPPRTYDLRSRFLYNDQRRQVLLLNYKCGFTTMAAATADDDQWKTDLRNVNKFAQAVSDRRFAGYDVHLLTRHPLARIISYYWNWFVVKDAAFTDANNPVNRHFQNLRDRAGDKVYETFAAASREERSSVEMFEQFVAWLPTLWPDDGHTHPQYQACTETNIGLDEVALWKMDNIAKLCATVGVEPIPAKNVSRDLVHEDLETPFVRRTVEMVYRRDYLEFGYSLS